MNVKYAFAAKSVRNISQKNFWRCRGSNPGPHTCKACALPLSYIPWHLEIYAPEDPRKWQRPDDPCVKELAKWSKRFTHGETRTRNLRFRRPTPYPLGHAGLTASQQSTCEVWSLCENSRLNQSLFVIHVQFGLNLSKNASGQTVIDQIVASWYELIHILSLHCDVPTMAENIAQQEVLLPLVQLLSTMLFGVANFSLYIFLAWQCNTWASWICPDLQP